MKANKVVNIILRAIPRASAWDAMASETYGSFGVDPAQDVKRVLYCVTPTYKVEKYFEEGGYDLLVAHHPYPAPSRTLPHIIVHTALDCCKGGLNDMWRDGLGIRNAKHFDKQLGWVGEVEPISLEDLCTKVEAFMERKIMGQVYAEEDRLIKSIVVCSGLGGSVNDLALNTNADCYIMGEACVKPELSGFPFIIETGHTNSEWIGARLIARLLNPHGITVDVAPDDIDVFSGEIHCCRRYTPPGAYVAQYAGKSIGPTYRGPIHSSSDTHLPDGKPVPEALKLADVSGPASGPWGGDDEFGDDDTYLFGLREKYLTTPKTVEVVKDRQLALSPANRKWRR